MVDYDSPDVLSVAQVDHLLCRRAALSKERNDGGRRNSCSNKQRAPIATLSGKGANAEPPSFARDAANCCRAFA